MEIKPAPIEIQEETYTGLKLNEGKKIMAVFSLIFLKESFIHLHVVQSLYTTLVWDTK